MKIKRIFLYMALLCFLTAACTVPELAVLPTETIEFPATLVSPTEAPTFTQSPTLIPPNEEPTIPPPPTQNPALTWDQLKNGQYYLAGEDRIYQLTDGVFSEGNDSNKVEVRLFPLTAYGDLNGDAVGDAVVLLAKDTGGTGVFISLAAVLSQKGLPAQLGAAFIDDRPLLTGLTITDGKIILDATIHFIDDPMCCPSVPVQVTYRIDNDRLVMVRFISQTSGGLSRAISINKPLDGQEVSGQVNVTGSVLIAPFENTLAYRFYGENGNLLAGNSFMVQAEEMGGPGTFDVILDLPPGTAGQVVRLEISELSPADGSILALASVVLRNID